ncbi:SDR family NAD(P)-dependent oxidoreductase [Bosea minatitlanensis]|uniref:SDR family NAD(P)-dependent oxidoreductase n=1 Tax=Bosea minatitlanensis TaxID=128782 RepID=A0ABW0EZA2_9HYPH|nr:SDR family NAD(P)-dependent oxidoreductase [Bosea minatitlanensis]MCT4492548.1 SDR family oxidoreductase [Bosea minatitlanensis]
MSEMRSKVALITGAGRGIGKATALVLAAKGFRIAVHDIDPQTAAETAALIRQRGAEAESFAADVADREAMAGVVAAVEAGCGTIDVLINNAGIASDRCPLEQVTEAMFARSIGVHVAGTLWTTQAVIAGMKQRKAGSIVNLSSIQALVGWTEGATYNAAKGALIAMSKGWAKEFAPWNIRVNVVAPGHTETEMTARNDSAELRAAKAKTIPLGRYARPSEIGEAIAFLAGDAASFVTGQVLSPNGGFAII